MEVALSRNSKMRTARGDAPIAATTPSLMSIDRRISIG
jgi:hypothetical protein